MFRELEEVVFSGGGQTTDVNEVDTKQPLPLLALFPRMGTRESGSQGLNLSWPINPLTSPTNTRRKLVDLVYVGSTVARGPLLEYKRVRFLPRKEV